MSSSDYGQYPQQPPPPPQGGAPGGPSWPGNPGAPGPPSAPGGYGGYPPYSGGPDQAGPGSGGSGGGSRGVLVVVFAVIAIALAAGGLVVGLALGNGGDDTAAGTTDPETVTETVTETGEATAAPAETVTVTETADAGGKVAEGETMEVGDFSMTLISVVDNADKQIARANQFNDPPSIGQYMITKWKTTWNGDGRADITSDVRIAVIGSDGTEYLDYECGAVEPRHILGDSEVRSGGSRRYDVCFDVPKSLPGGSYTVRAVYRTDAGEELTATWER